jgi:hypothetical protein
MQVIVLFTDLPHTLKALRAGSSLASDLHATLEIIAVRALPYPTPLTSYGQAAFLQHLRQGLAGTKPEISIKVYFCRDSVQTLFRILPPHAIVVIAWPRAWWSSARGRWRTLLQSAGHHVVCV